MKKVFIKYNPYKLETEITVDGDKPPKNSKLLEKSKGSRLQDWVEELPGILREEYRVEDFEIRFHGTLLDYEDLESVLKETPDGRKLNIKYKHICAKETSDKEALIEEIFEKIQKGPFDELCDAQIKDAFQLAKSSDFEVCVVGITSVGKSTLINAMLRQYLIPYKPAANTAVITRIKDDKNVKGKKKFKMEVLDVYNRKLESPEFATLNMLEKYNACPIKYRCGNSTPKCPESPLKPDECSHMDKDIPSVDTVRLYGNIPFVSSDDVSLVLIDTPGPDYSQDPRHGKVQSEFLGKSSKALVLYMMTGGYGTDDDNALLRSVSKSMKVGGKQPKDRFIFVVNQLDDIKEGEKDANEILKDVRSYLKAHGVENPNLFPAAAKPALNIRRIINGANVDDVTDKETKLKVRKLNRNVTLHFETFATLPASIRGEIDCKLEATRSKYHGPDNENKEEALIHTGIISIEAAIRQYVQKYAKTEKIRNIVATFMHKIDELAYFENLKSEIALDEKKIAMRKKQIDSIEKKIDSAEEAKKFKKAVDDSVVKVNYDSREVVEGIRKKFQEVITKRIDTIRKKKIELDEVVAEVGLLERFANELVPEFRVELEELIRTKMVDTSNALLEGYREKLASLIKDIDPENLTGVSIDPLKLMAASVTYSDFSIIELVKREVVPDGQEYVRTRDWFESIAFWPKSEWVAKYKTVKYVNGGDLAQEFFTPLIKNLIDNGEAARKYALEQSERIADDFTLKFKDLDEVLKKKLDKLKGFTIDKEEAEKRVMESKRNLKWLEEIKTNVESILEI